MTATSLITRVRGLKRLQQTLALERIERRSPSTDAAPAPQELPFARYRDDPVAFVVEVLGVQPWSRQAEILTTVAGCKKVAVRSGHKVGKSLSAAILAAWWISTRPRAKVVLTSSSWENVKETLWPELKRLHRQSKQSLGGYLLDTAAGGWRFDDGRACFGVSTSTPERAAGKSGEEMLYIVDEASGIDDKIFEAIEGNLAGGAPIVMFGNPTQQSGQFYRAFLEETDVWATIHVSSEESPNVVEGRIVIAGLATREWVLERKKKWGERDARYLVRVRGDFADKAANAVIGITTVEEARKRWEDTSETGLLEIGIDVARFGDDDTVIYPTRGKKALEPVVLSGQDTVQIVGAALDLVRVLVLPGERPRVKVDVIGVGAGVADLLRTHDEVETIDVNVAESSDDPDEFHNLRAQLWFGLNDWLVEGGAIPPTDGDLSVELKAPRFSFDARGRRQIEKKEDIKERLGRSPDKAEALMLAVAKRRSAGPPPRAFPTRFTPGDHSQNGAAKTPFQW